MEKFTSMIILSVFCMVVCFVAPMSSEPICSKFDYEIKTLETMLRTEQKVENMLQEMKRIQDSVSKDLGELESLKVKMSSDFDSLTKDVDKQISDEITQLNSDMDIVTKNADNKLREMDLALDHSTDVTIAFSVRNPTKSMVSGVPTFSQTITNIGGAYNMDTGVFTSPVGGLYIFVLTVASEGKQDVYCRIRHNNDNQVFSRTYNDNSYTTASNSVFLSLSKGDTVTLGGCGGWTNVYSSNYETTFGGALIKQTS